MTNRHLKITLTVGLVVFFAACGQKDKKTMDDNSIFKSNDTRNQEQKFLDKHVFDGLTNLNSGFDAEGIKYFSEREFSIVLARVKELGLGITGIEPWKDGEFYGVETYEEFTTDPTDSNWYLSSFERFKKTGDTIQYAASYYIPAKLLGRD